MFSDVLQKVRLKERKKKESALFREGSCTVKLQLSGFARKGLNGPDNQESSSSKNMNINEPKTKPNNLEKSQ